MAAATTGQSIPDVVKRHRRIRLVNLTKLIDVELNLLKESFQEAKCRIDPMIAQINLARDKFDELVKGGEIMMEVEMERELRDLKQETSKLKYKIPFNLITPEFQPAADPNVILQPQTRPTTTTTSNPPVVVDDDAFLGARSEDFPYFRDYFRDRLKSNPYALESRILRCFLAFPEGAFIKASLLCSFVNGTVSPSGRKLFVSLEDIVLTASVLVSQGFIKSVYKKHSSTTVHGFWMDPFLHCTFKDCLCRTIQLECLVNSSSVNGENIIYSGSAGMPSDLRFLHLGVWQRSPTHHNIEMPDPNLYFKYADDVYDLEYISFRGVSVMKELPAFIIGLWDLSILDVKACHHLEVLPPDIGNLRDTLTHLDMSECYFLDHMPESLSRLTGLRVLKGFFVGETNNEEDESCTLQDLSSMVDLVKLNIHTSLKTFPSANHLTVLQGFEYLHNLTICWGGCSTTNKIRESRPRKTSTVRLKRLIKHIPDHPVARVDKRFLHLEKLDLRGAPEMGTRDWLKPSNFEKLEKLYIRGGQLSHLAQKDKQIASLKEKGWSVKILRLRHLSKLKMDWSEVRDSFPNVVSLEKVECPNLTSFPCDEDGLWTKETTRLPADGMIEQNAKWKMSWPNWSRFKNV